MSMDDYIREVQNSSESLKLSLDEEDVSFAIFILTNGRSGKLMTYDYLREHGYDGLIYLVVDDLDSEKDAYIQKYGDEVIVFDKQEWAEKSDRVHNMVELRTVTYARNFTIELAKRSGIQYYAMLDDDFNSFSVRYEQDNSLKGSPIKDMSAVFKAYVQYMYDCDIMVTGFGGAGSYIGGLTGQFSKGITGNVAGAFIFKTELTQGQFKGYVNEDTIFGLEALSKGQLIFRILNVMYSTPERGSNSGGHSDLYEAESSYIQESITHIARPSEVSLIADGDRVSSRLSWSKATPKVLSERWVTR